MSQQNYQLMRPPDHVWLTITTDGFSQQTGANGPELIADNPQARLIVELPPQHIAET
ncbi:MAG: hypothetical protein QOC63_1699, partial [Mycobacterium sp.]|nr:hypothetical protein [Mycobacterium sp.]